MDIIIRLNAASQSTARTPRPVNRGAIIFPKMKREYMEVTLRPATVSDIEFIYELRVKTMMPLFEGTIGWDKAAEREKAAEELTNAEIAMVGGKREGLLVAISNPKAILFFTVLFPQFIDLSKPIVIQFTILTSTFMFFSFFVLVIYAITAHSAKCWFAKRNRTIWLNRISGTIFITFGLGILRLRNRSV